MGEGHKEGKRGKIRGGSKGDMTERKEEKTNEVKSRRKKKVRGNGGRKTVKDERKEENERKQKR